MEGRGPVAAAAAGDVVRLDGGAPLEERRWGGKAAGLARLVAAGFHVPPGLCVSADVFRRHTARALDGDRGPAVFAFDRSGRLDAARLEMVAARVRATPLDPAVVEAVDRTLRELRLEGRPVAVRSSGNFEDRADWSAAGQQETVLGCVGTREVCAAILRCYAAAFRPATVAYLRRAGIPLEEVSLALVVQALVRAEASGVLFTLNPVTGNTGELVVNALCGGGEALVSGRRTPESLVLDRATLRVLRRDEPPGAARPALDNGRARDLGRLALRAERILGGPLDIEWAFDAEDPDRIALLQARPITAVHPVEPPEDGGPAAPSRRRLALLPGRRPDPSRWVWTNANVGEALPGVATPFTWSVALGFSRLGFERAFATLGCSVPHDAVLVGRFHGRIYLNATEFLRIASQVPLLTPSHIERLGGVPGLGRLHAERNVLDSAAFVLRLPLTLARLARANLGLDAALDDYERRLASERARLAARDLRGLDGGTLLAELDRRARWLDETGSLMLTCASNSLSSYVALGTLLRLWLPGQAEQLLAGLMAGFADLESAQPGLALWHISEIVRLDAPARAVLEGAPPERLRLDDFPADGPTRRALAGFLRAYGFRAVREAELSTPRWSEDPAFLFATLRSYLASEVGAPLGRVERQKEARRRAVEAVERDLPAGKFALVRHALRLAQKYTRLRERMRSRVTEVLGWYRAFALEVGRRLGDRDAGFFLDLDAVRAFLRGALPADEAAAIVAENRERFAADVARPDPPTVFVGSPPPLVPPATEGTELCGVGASPGRAEGFVRVLREPAEADRLVQGEVLVVPHADVGWSPLFLVASAVGTGMGGTLSHAAIVAREYGVPAVFGVPGVVGRLRTGDRVVVDGTAGTVALVRSGS
ncbi:MAG: hypothetical protein GYA57_15050 [Myxococcales bacterium]|nr:hypothetical protein [Myxococcales bacterium]